MPDVCDSLNLDCGNYVGGGDYFFSSKSSKKVAVSCTQCDSVCIKFIDKWL